MGLFSWLFSQPEGSVSLPKVISILPDLARQEINLGRLPIINSDKIFLKSGEICHYIDKAILLKEKTNKTYVSNRIGSSMPGLFKGDRINFGHGNGHIDEEKVTEFYKGILFITNKRIVFMAKENGFDKLFKTLSTIKPYTNAIELQFGAKSLCLIVSDGDLIYKALKLINR